MRDMGVPDLGGSFSGQNGGDLPKVSDRFTIERVESFEVLSAEWEPVFIEVFPDENDREPLDLLQERLEAGENFFLMRNQNGEPIGIELSQTLLDDEPGRDRKALYVPWTGVLEQYRNIGVGSQMNRTINEFMKEQYGITHTIIDIEDPSRLHDSGYSAEELPEAIENATRRINFWRREGFDVVDDEAAPAGQKLEYARPASDDESKIQAYDHLTVRIDDDALRANVISEDGTQISKDFVRECYLEMNQIQYGAMSEAELRAEYPAIDQYFRDIDQVPGQWLALHAGAIKPKSTPAIRTENVTMSLASQGDGFDHGAPEAGL